MKNIIIYTIEKCNYCIKAKDLLNKKCLLFKEIKCDTNPKIRSELARKIGCTSVPQIWIGNIYVGGFDQLYHLAKLGKLDLIINNN